jgi:hypothetical protein
MVSGWAAGVRFLWRKQGVSPLPLSIGEVMSLHPRKDTTRNRVCKHALVLTSHPGTGARDVPRARGFCRGLRRRRAVGMDIAL